MVPYRPHHNHPEARMAGMANKTGIPNEAETAPPAYVESSFRTSFASISLHKTDRIRLLQFPPEDIAAIRAIIKQNWGSGIQDERTYANSHEFKCIGNPWSGQGADSIPARILMCGILAYLYSCGWILTASTDISKSILEKDTMIFRKQVVPPPPSEWMAISFNQGDRLRLIGAPTELIVEFQVLLKAMGLWQEGAWKDRTLNAWEFKLNGWPFKSSGSETMAPRLLLLRMLETLEMGGWSLYATIDQNNGRSGNNHAATGTDSWYCQRAVDWVPGNSVLHR
jgi:hypothetical protein